MNVQKTDSLMQPSVNASRVTTLEDDVQISIDVVLHDQQCLLVCCQHLQQASQDEVDGVQRLHALIQTRARNHLMKLKEKNRLATKPNSKSVGVVDQNEQQGQLRGAVSSPLSLQQNAATGGPSLLVNVFGSFYQSVMILYNHYRAAFTAVSSSWLVDALHRKSQENTSSLLQPRDLPFYRSTLPIQAFLPYLRSERVEGCRCLAAETKKELISKRIEQSLLPDNVVAASIAAGRMFYDLCVPGRGDYYSHISCIELISNNSTTSESTNDDDDKVLLKKIQHQRSSAGMGKFANKYHQFVLNTVFGEDHPENSLPLGSTMNGNLVHCSAPWKNSQSLALVAHRQVKHGHTIGGSLDSSEDVATLSCVPHASLWRQHGSSPLSDAVKSSTAIDGLARLQLHQLYDSAIGIQHNAAALARLVIEREQADPAYTDITDTLHLTQSEDQEWEVENSLTTAVLQLSVLPQYSVALENNNLQREVQLKTAKQLVKLVYPQMTMIQEPSTLPQQ